MNLKKKITPAVMTILFNYSLEGIKNLNSFGSVKEKII